MSKQISSLGTTLLTNIPKWNDYIRDNAVIIAGKIRSIQGMCEMNVVSHGRRELTSKLFIMLHGNVSATKKAMSSYLMIHPEILEVIQELIICNQKLQGREVSSSDMPKSLNSYTLISLSMLLETDVDLTYGLSNVTDGELNDYIREHTSIPRTNIICGGRRKKTIKSRKGSRRHNTHKHYRN